MGERVNNDTRRRRLCGGSCLSMTRNCRPAYRYANAPDFRFERQGFRPVAEMKVKEDSRILRGGSWIYYAGYCRSAYRRWIDPGYRGDSLGFRSVADSRGPAVQKPE